ncbi:hypothetical protein [Deinococcus sp.]|uniref:hypothetical protein n=1 Tax=Deinococcus sp. TaxID=47478 RepID=UPI0025FB0E15|nr:hypothetical protein [Deinococcus sp.]
MTSSTSSPARPVNPLRPSQPLPLKPAGYLGLASYSSLGRFWTYLDAARRNGRDVGLVRGDPEATCRRRISGYLLDGAGLLIDAEKVGSSLDEGLEPHPALIALLGGDSSLLRETLNLHYALRLNFVLAFTRHRDLILRPEFKFVLKPVEKDHALGDVQPLDWNAIETASAPLPPLPKDVPLNARRLGRDELRFLLERACGL